MMVGGRLRLRTSTGDQEEMDEKRRSGCRRKGIGVGVKRWMVVSETGESCLEDVDRHSIMRRTGLVARDLRIVDPMLSYPSSILGRDRAIVVNLEHIKAIITANQVLLINSSDPFFLRFLQDLQTRLSKNGSVEEGVPVSPPPKRLPFEFRALEACIESACTCLESETRTLEEEAYPALDELTSQISSLNLERVRQIKNRLTALSGRVQKSWKRNVRSRRYMQSCELMDTALQLLIRKSLLARGLYKSSKVIDEQLCVLADDCDQTDFYKLVADQLENLLDDDNDMAEMYLTQKLDARLLDQASPKEGNNSAALEDVDESDESSSVKDKSPGPTNKPVDVEELEMLLEAYFAQINGILQNLSSLSEYVDDTEDYINIMLDDKRNQLLQVAVIFNTLNMIVNAGIVVVGLFGMNIHIELFDGQPHQFWATASGTLGGCIFLFLLSYWGGKKRYLLSQ